MWAISLPLMLLLVGCDKPIITIDLKGQSSIPAQPAAPRFQIVMHPEYPGVHTYLLDTQTGTIWKKTTIDTKTVWLGEVIVNRPSQCSGAAPRSFEEWDQRSGFEILGLTSESAGEKK